MKTNEEVLQVVREKRSLTDVIWIREKNRSVIYSEVNTCWGKW